MKAVLHPGKVCPTVSGVQVWAAGETGRMSGSSISVPPVPVSTEGVGGKLRGLPGGLLELETVQSSSFERQDSHGRTLLHLSFRLRHWSQATLERALCIRFWGARVPRCGEDARSESPTG